MHRLSTFMLCITLLVVALLSESHITTVQADAVPSGCDYINQNNTLSGGTNGLDFLGYFNAGDVITMTATSAGSQDSFYIFNWDTAVDLVGSETIPVVIPTTLTWIVPSSGNWDLFLGFSAEDNPTGTLSCQHGGGGGGGLTLRTITVWGVVDIRAVSWQFEDSSGKWWWLLQPDKSTRIQTPIEYRDRTKDGKLVPHYAMSRLTTVIGTTQNDPKTYRAFDADTLAPLHQIWFELGDEADPARLSVFVP